MMEELMSDLISRRAAIDFLGEEPEVWCGDIGEYAVREQWRADVSAIKAVPSAEPEIIHCRECVYGKQDYDGWWYCRSFGCQVGDEDGSGFCSNAEKR